MYGFGFAELSSFSIGLISQSLSTRVQLRRMSEYIDARHEAWYRRDNRCHRMREGNGVTRWMGKQIEG